MFSGIFTHPDCEPSGRDDKVVEEVGDFIKYIVVGEIESAQCGYTDGFDRYHVEVRGCEFRILQDVQRRDKPLRDAPRWFEAYAGILSAFPCDRWDEQVDYVACPSSTLNVRPEHGFG